jgi:nucleoside-diphosphate-sugar epimerase
VTKALITGGLGFIGCHLAARLLAEGFEVDAFDNGQRGAMDSMIKALAAGGRYRPFLLDITEEGAFTGLADDYELVFHLAAIVGVRNVIGQPYRVLCENTAALVRMIDWSRGQKKLRRFVFPSTSEVYAGTLENFGMLVPTPEDTPLAVSDLALPRTSYMLSKIYGEALCQHSDLPFTIVRPHNVYGPRMGMAHVIPELLQRAHQAHDGDALVVFSPAHSRTFCYVDDAVELIVRLALSPLAIGETFNVGSSDEETSMTDLAAIVIRTVGRPTDIEPGPCTEGSPVRRRPDMSRALACTSRRAFLPLAEGVRRTYEWYRANVFEVDQAVSFR